MSTGDQGMSGFGTTVSGSVTGEIGHLTRVSVGTIEVNDIDISSMNNTDKWKEFVSGMKNAGEIRMDLVYEEDELALIMATVGGASETWTVTFPDTATFVCSGYIKSIGPIEAPMDDKMAMTVSIKLSGTPTYTPVTGT